MMRINLKKILWALMFVVAGAMTASAVPAHPRPMDVTQSDGSKLTVRLVGDEFYHRTMTTDGYTLLQRSNGDYVYAVESGSRLVASDVVAHNPMMRNAGELKMLSSLQKGLTDKAMIAKGKNLRVNRDKLNAANRAENDDFRGLLVLINFNDRTFTYGADYFEAMMNQPNYTGYYRTDGSFVPCTGSARDYYVDNSMGQFEPQFDIVGPVNVNYSCTYPHGYEPTAGEVFVAAINALDPSIDFSQYDRDQDGVVDMIYFVVAGYTANFSGNNSGYLWPHQYYMYYYTDQLYDGVYLGRYSCSGEIYGWEDYGYTDPDGMGTIVHEFTHALGLMDLYDTDGSQNGEASDPGEWDVMAGGNYLNDSHTPAGLSIWERYRLGFAEPELINEFKTGLTVEPLNTTNTGYWLATPNENEFFMIENRQNSRWDAYLPGHGMMIARVEYDEDIWWSNSINCDASHMHYELLRAGNGTWASPSDPFPGSNNVTEINNLTTPSLLTWAGQENDFGFANIAENNGIITFDVVNGDGTPGVHGFDPGDVNHDHEVAISDVSVLIDYLLDAENTPICLICADVNGEDGVTIADVSALIDILLGL